MPLVLMFYVFSFALLGRNQNWFFIWMRIEINTFTFIVIVFFIKNIKKDILILFFSIQTISSFILLTAFLLLENKMPNIVEISYTLILAIIIKMGAAPLHNWSIPIGIICSPLNIILFLTIQKIFPFFIIKRYSNFFFYFFLLFLIWGVLWGATQNISQRIFKNIIIISRISQLSWLLFRLINLTVWETYFIFYLCILVSIKKFFKKNLLRLFSQKNNFLIIILFITLGGLPPLIGFFPKAIVIKISLILTLGIILSIILFFSLLDLYVYLRLRILRIFEKKIIFRWRKSLNKKYIWLLVSINITVFMLLII
jgi:NADH-ubiquinone oxidoreductase chain 2